MTNFAVSTGQLGAAIRSLARRSTTTADAARIWLDVLGVFFPNDQGFERVEAYSAPNCVLMEVRRDRDSDGDAIVVDDNNNAKAPFLIVDCRPHNTFGYNWELDSLQDNNHREGGIVSFKFGVISIGAQTVFLEDVVASHAMQDTPALRGVRVGSANLIKASGRDKTEEWLRCIRNLCDQLGGMSQRVANVWILPVKPP